MSGVEIKHDDIVGVLLAGGLARRMGGGDKSMASVGGRPILDRIIDRARPQVGPLILNANGDPARFAEHGLPVVADVVDGFAGPLAGILTALEWAAADAPNCVWVASFATDAPFLPADLVARLAQALGHVGRAHAPGLRIVARGSGGRTAPRPGRRRVAQDRPLDSTL